MTMSCLRRGIAAACLSVAASPAIAETFVMSNGEVINGTVIRSIGNTLSIKFDGAGMKQVPVGDVESIEITTADGGTLIGRIVGWSSGVYSIATDQGDVEATVEDGVAIALAGAAATNTIQATEVPAPPSAPPADGDAPIKAGFVYAGLVDDGGRTFMREKGRLQLADNPSVGGTQVVEIEAEDAGQTATAIDRLIADGANVVFTTGHNSSAAIAASAEQHRDVQFVHCGPFDPAPNIEVVCGRIYQARYLAGIVAGGMTEAGLIGYVAAEPNPATIVGINAFALGAQSVNADAQVMVHWTQSWYAPGEEQRHAEELVDRGVDVLTIHQDSPAALQVAERLGVHAIGFQSDMRAFAPSATLTSAVWNWGEMYDQAVGQLQDGTPQLRAAWLGLREGVVGLAPLSNRIPDDLKRLVEQHERELIEGRFNVFTGPIRDVDGDVRVLDGRMITDESLQTMDYFVQGVVGY